MTVDEIVQCIEDVCITDAFCEAANRYGVVDRQRYDKEYDERHSRLIRMVEMAHSSIQDWSKDELVKFITSCYKPVGELSCEIRDYFYWLPIMED